MATATTIDFLSRLFQGFDDGWLTLFSINPTTGDRRTDWYRYDDIDRMSADALAMTDRNVWFGLASRTNKLDGGRRGGRVDCAQIGCLWLDIDVAGTNHADIAGMLPDIDTARAIVKSFPLQPSIVVNSGGGYHPYWLLDEPMNADEAEQLLARWATTWARLAREQGCSIDNVSDLPRILRVPGTLNHKNNVTVEIGRFSNDRYGPTDIIDATDEPPAPTSTERNTPYTGAERPGDDFNARHTGGHVLNIAGWKLEKVKNNKDEAWVHPWSPTSDESATVYADDGHTTIWSDTVPNHAPVVTRRPYDPFGLYTNLIHNGDWRAATIELAKQGYGAATMRSLLGLPALEPFGDTPPSDDDITKAAIQRKPTIFTNGRHLDELADEVVHILVAGNNPPNLFRHGDAVSQLARGELEAVDRIRMINVVERSMRPTALRSTGPVPTRLDPAAVELSILRLLDQLPVINSVMRSPFLRADGTVCGDLGYDGPSGNYLTSTINANIINQPTAEDVQAAVAFIDDLIHDFPLNTPSDRAHVFALLLTPLIRHLVPLTPLFVLDGNGPGVGKNLLAECCMYVATGEWIQTDPLPLDAEEQRKQITALMSTGRSVALFDEAHIISGTSLARLVTSTTWGDRLLGYSKQVAYPNRITVVALGNNVEVQGDMPRRCILIRLESQLARPYDRQDFRHNDLRTWIEQHRADVLSALLTMLTAWHQAGRPNGADRLGSFDQWAAIIGGTLNHARVEGFLSNINEMRDRGATDDTEMEAHLYEVRQRVGDDSFSARLVAGWIDDNFLDAIPPRLPGDHTNHARALGHIYRRYSGRWLGDIRIEPDGMTHGAKRWVTRILTSSVDNYPETGCKGGLGGSVLPTRESYLTKSEGDATELPLSSQPKIDPPNPPFHPDPDDRW